MRSITNNMKEIMEKWIAVPGYEGIYSVSSHGRVKSNERIETTSAGWSRKKNEKLLSYTYDHSGRPYVDLCIRYSRNRHYIHRLVLVAFIGDCPKGMEACHNDGNHLNNNLSNLRWDNHSNNMLDKIQHGTHIHGELHKLSKLTVKDVLKIRQLRTEGKTHQVISEEFNVSRRLIGGILSGKKWKYVS